MPLAGRRGKPGSGMAEGQEGALPKFTSAPSMHLGPRFCNNPSSGRPYIVGICIRVRRRRIPQTEAGRASWRKEVKTKNVGLGVSQTTPPHIVPAPLSVSTWTLQKPSLTHLPSSPRPPECFVSGGECFLNFPQKMEDGTSGPKNENAINFPKRRSVRALLTAVAAGQIQRFNSGVEIFN